VVLLPDCVEVRSFAETQQLGTPNCLVQRSKIEALKCRTVEPDVCKCCKNDYPKECDQKNAPLASYYLKVVPSRTLQVVGLKGWDNRPSHLVIQIVFVNNTT